MTFFLFASVVALFVSTINAQEFYHPVEGNCSDIFEIRNATNPKVPSGVWYIPYTTLGGVSCVGAYALRRGNKSFGDVRVLPEGQKKYVFFPNDVVYQEKEQSYSVDDGATAVILTTDEDNYVYFVQCLVKDGKTQVGVFFGTREAKVDDEAISVYRQYNENLAAKKLLPELHEISLENCPPVLTVKM